MSKKLLQDMARIKHPNSEISTSQKRAVRFNSQHIDKSIGVSGGHRYTLWFVAFVSIIFFVFSISFLFLQATITINPKVKDLVLDQNLSASLGGGTDALAFDSVIISGEENKTVQVTTQKDVSVKAEGVVLIYNSFSSASQVLSIDTRLLGSNGKIYKTRKQIVVPGMKVDIPGSIEADIYADLAGEEYNSDPLDFTIFGFKGTSKYSKFYARSKAAISGGFKGKGYAISNIEKLTALNDLRTILQAKLFKQAMGQIPAGFILFKDATFLDTEDNSTSLVYSKSNMLPMKIKGTFYGLLFNENKLTQKIIESNINGYDGSDVYLQNIKDLTFSLLNKDSVLLKGVKNINFNLKGNTKIVWKLDENKLVADLLGKSKKDFNQTLLQYPNVNSAELVLSPFWRTSLPSKTKDIKVIVNYPK
ncbi:MAG: hypothetical protein WCG28_01450 [bacterium]